MLCLPFAHALHGGKSSWLGARGSLRIVTLLCAAIAADSQDLLAADTTPVLHKFERKQLTGEYYSEGANAGDLNNDGHVDIVSGPYWFAGPEFTEKQEIYTAKPQDRHGYADNFFSWIYDFNSDGRDDIFVVGFPATPAYVYENPGPNGFDKPWPKHEVIDSVANESPHFVNVVGDDRPELVCTNGGFYGFATVDWEKPLERWTFHPVSDGTAAKQFGHGLGVGDVNGDGRMDILQAGGWFEQPASDAEKQRWRLHNVSFTDSYGGAEMYAYDVDDDGDNDIITSLAAHDFGLAWYEQDRAGDKTVFRMHRIVGSQPEQNRYGVVFSEPHSVALADMDGDGLKDIVTGKTYWSHHDRSPLWDAGAVVYWFKLVRHEDGIDWIPYLADTEAGIGRQVIVQDVNDDKLLDIIVGGMKGAHVLLHTAQRVDEATWKAAQPKPISTDARKSVRRTPSPIDEKSGQVLHGLEGEELQVVDVSAGRTATQGMEGFAADRWSGDQQLFWTGAMPGAKLVLEFSIEEAGKFDLSAAFTMASDYGVVRLQLDDKPLGEPMDLYNNPDVITTGELKLGEQELSAGKHRLTIEIVGANPSAVKAYMVGVDYIRLVPQ